MESSSTRAARMKVAVSTVNGPEGNCWLVNAAADAELFAGDPAGVIGGEEDRGLGNVLRLAGTAERRVLDGILFEFRTGDAGGVRALGDRQGGIERIDADFLRPEFLREHAGDGVDRALRAGVNGAVRRGDVGDD